MVLLVTALTAAAPPAFPAPPESRAEALAALKNTDTATRAEAVVWIANRGTMTDAPLLHERLRDESAFVRNFAEQGLWLLWTRSGDAEVDALMAPRHGGNAGQPVRPGHRLARSGGAEETRRSPKAGTAAPRSITWPASCRSRSPTATRC